MNANQPFSPLPGRACARLAAPALLAFLLTGACLRAEPATQAAPAQADRMAWFRDAKLGIFIHWGIYSKGVGSES